MALRYPGGIISATAPTVTTSSAKGVWTLSEALQYKQAGTWPTGGDPVDPYTYQFLPGKLYAVGANYGGQIGDNTLINKSSPVQVGTATNWKYVTTNAFGAAAVNSSGQLYVWGVEASVLNLGSFTTPPSYSSPVQVGTSTDWASVDMGYSTFAAAIKTNGTLWTWGYNNTGNLGLGDLTNRSSPTQVGTDTNWAPFKLSAQQQQVLAIKTDGTLWAWGNNSAGQLGDGTAASKSSPVQIGSGTNWGWVHSGYQHTFAIKTDGTLWAWGSNGNGALGLNVNPAVNYSSPVQVGTDTNWRYAFAGYSGVSYAQRSDGTLWTWGNPASGALADNQAVTYRSSPVQVGSSTNWKMKYVRQSYSPGNGLRDSGLWVWGNNSTGELGQNNANNYSSPVQVGTYSVNSSIRGYDDTYFIGP